MNTQNSRSRNNHYNSNYKHNTFIDNNDYTVQIGESDIIEALERFDDDIEVSLTDTVNAQAWLMAGMEACTEAWS
jgi:hypothetical protein